MFVDVAASCPLLFLLNLMLLGAVCGCSSLPLLVVPNLLCAAMLCCLLLFVVVVCCL